MEPFFILTTIIIVIGCLLIIFIKLNKNKFFRV